jgi:hypothetical protein
MGMEDMAFSGGCGTKQMTTGPMVSADVQHVDYLGGHGRTIAIPLSCAP